MDLLLESKRMWLFSYLIFVVILASLYFVSWENYIGKTCAIMLLDMLIIVLVFFIIIIFFKYNTYIRLVATCLYLGITIYEGINSYICKWYIIIPVFLITELYMLWNLGGVINCIIASGYKRKLEMDISYGIESYISYADEVDQFNKRNNLGFWSKVRVKREPRWQDLEFDTSGIEMFYIENALCGVNSYIWNKKVKKINKINTRLKEKNNALESNQTLYSEKESLDRVISKNNTAGIITNGLENSVEKLDGAVKRNRKKSRRILKRRL
jgi:hypothetical protein